MDESPSEDLRDRDGPAVTGASFERTAERADAAGIDLEILDDPALATLSPASVFC